jgi:hypothetical protein
MAFDFSNKFGRSRVVGLLAVLALTAVFAVQMMGQSIVTGDVAGTVTDPSNAVVSGAKVTMTSVDTNASESTTTNSTGFYRFSLVKPGNYKISIAQSGFRTTTANLAVVIGQVNMVNAKLELGQGSETVEVSGAAPLIQTEDGNISTSYSQRQLETLPAPGGDITSYAYTAPGVVVSNGAGYGNFSSFGLPSTANLFTTNGNDNMDPFLNVNNSGASNLTLGANELQEISVISNGYTAQYGRQAGAQVNASTKSGSNAFHGNLSYDYNGTNLNANDWFANASNFNTNPTGAFIPTPRPHAVNNSWTGSIGGPIVKNKLFFFFDQEGLRFVLPGVSGAQTIPSPQFAAYTLAHVSAASLPFYKNIFSLYGGAPGAASATPVAGGGCQDFTGLGAAPCAVQFTSNQNNLIHEWILSGRVDYKINSSDTLFGRYKMDRGVQATGTDPINSAFNANSVQPQYEGQLNETHIFNNTTINSLIVSGSWYKALFGPPDFAKATATFPTTMIFFGGVGSFVNLGGTDNAFPQGRIVTQYQITDDFSKTTGPHDIKIGINFRRNLVSDYSALAGTTGTLNIQSLTEFANGTLDAANPQSFYNSNFSNVGAVKVKVYSLGAYVQDQWKMTSKLNLTLALRLDRNSNPVCDHCFTRMIGPFQSVTHDPSAPYNQTIQTGLNSAFSSVEKVAFSPRIGFAYNVDPNTVIRGGFGIFDDLFPATLVDRFITNAPNVSTFASQSAGAPISFDVPGNLQQQATALNATFQQQFASGLTLAGLGGPGNGPTFYTMGNKLNNPKFAEWNLEVQRQLGNKYSVGLNYVGNHGYDIITINPWLNASCLAFDAVNNPGGCKPGQLFGGIIGNTPTDPRFNEVVDLSNNAYSNYHGVTGSFKVKPMHGFSGQFNYTWAHDLDTCSNNCIEPFVANTLVSLRYQASPLLPGRAYGNSDYDVRHNFNLNYVYQSPESWSNRGLKYALGGWTVGGTMFYHTGLPWSAVDLASRSELTDVTGLRNATPLATFLSAPPSSGCGTAAAQAGAGIASGAPCVAASSVAIGTLGFGNFARNSLRGAGFFNTDLSLSKGFRVTERFHFAVGANAFNLVNHQNFDLPTNSVTSGRFGQITSTIGSNTNPYGAFFGVPLNGRILQVFGKVTF